ncbi:MAG: PDZ domain-containing protein [Chloroflexi bacterium]|nr:PDZ domain-containing protein [Chloroflexota bacterium]
MNSKENIQKETLFLRQPSVSKNEIAFIYAGDVWIANKDGSNPRRLTAQKGTSRPVYFSPDGEWLTFSAQYDSGWSVYVISREGGAPRRLTYHPAEEIVQGWTQDGRHILFASDQRSPHARQYKLFTVPVEGGLPTELPMDMAFRGAYSPDGKYLAYIQYPEAFWTWKRYRGGMTCPIMVLDLKSLDEVKIPHENATDTFPCWVGKDIYFLSDRNRITNVFRWVAAANTVEQLTFHDDYDVRSLSAGPDCLVYEQAGRIHVVDFAGHKSTPLHISLAVELPETRPQYKKAKDFIQNANLSPSGQRAVFEARGDIFSVPAKKGDIRNLTQTTGVCERFPAWSADGQSIAWFSDASGEYDLVISDQKGVKKTVVTLGKKSFFYTPLWSPDSKKIAFTDKALNLYYLDVETKEVIHVDSETYDHPERTLNPAWSPDSKWLAYTRRLDNQIRAVFLYELETKTISQVTDGMSDATDACFSRDGKYLYFTASSNFGLNVGWLDLSSTERTVLRGLYAAVLSSEEPSPFAPESDEEKPEEKPAVEKKSEENGMDAIGNYTAKKTEDPVVKVDLEGLQQRIVALPVAERTYSRLQAAENKLFYLEVLPNQPMSDAVPAFSLNVFDFKERKSEIFVERVQNYWLSANGKMLMYRAAGGNDFSIVSIDKKPAAGDGALNLDAMQILVDPKAEWKQIFREAFRVQRDFFYDAGMHGLDLEAAYRKYLPFLEHVAHRDDLNYLMCEFSGEIVAGHIFIMMGDIPAPDVVPVGLLGADYEVNADGFYRIKKIYDGINWHPELRSPLTEPGVNIKEGEYILAVNGKPLRSPDNIYRLFEQTADKVTDLLVGETSDMEKARTVTVKPLASEALLRHWAWIEGNRKKVDELSDGRVAYVYMPDTSLDGYANFNRYYFSQLDKEAVVLDERFNAGGSVADYVIDLLNRPLLSYWATREGKSFATPNGSIFGPKAMIINELAGSGGDAMPHFFRRRGLGKLVGKRTWGGLIGIYDYPVLMDGGRLTSPRLAIFSPDGEWEVENVGISADVEVEMAPKEVFAGHDPQLEKAVEVVLEELKAHPFERKPRPAPINRVK